MSPRPNRVSTPTKPYIRPARPEEAADISTLAIRSKTHWGYPPEQLAVFRQELTLHSSDLARFRAHVLEHDGTLLGFYTKLGAHLEREISSSIPGRTIPYFSQALTPTRTTD